MPRRSRLALSLLLVLLSGFQGSAEPRAPDGFVGSFVWRMRDEAFGGFSGIEVSANGQTFVALSDRAKFVTGRFDRDKAGRIKAVAAGSIRPLVAAKSGKPLTGRRADSEGLAISADGQAYVSFESRARVARVNLKTGAVRDMQADPDFANLPKNGALEALAIDADDTLYAIPEDPPGAPKALPVYRWIDGAWDNSFTVPRRGRFVPVAADFGPDGRFYLLERDFRGIAGFSSRLRRFDVTDTGFRAEKTLLQTPFSLHDNLEGLAIWRDRQGFLRATMISDDNFIFVQQTQIVEYRLPD